MKRLGISICILIAMTLGLLAEKVALVGGTVHTLVGDPIENGVVLIDGNVLAGVGAGLAVPTGYRTVDVSGSSVFPGLINGNTALGLNEYGGLVPSSVDTNETTDPVTPQLRVTDAFHLDSRNIPVVRKYGVTVALVTPGESNVFAGQSAVVSLGPGLLSDVVIKAPAAMHINLGQPPRGTYGSRNRLPMTRMGTAALVRQTLIDAARYAEKKKADSATATNLAYEALLPVLRGEVAVIFRAQRLDDILTATRLSDEFGLKTILSHASDAYKVADLLSEKNISVLLGPVTTQPASMETRGAIYENAARLAAAGVKFAIVTGGAQQAGRLPFEAGIAAAYGLDPEEALRSITLYAAQILGIDDRYGSLERGKAADVVVAEGLILQPRARVTHVFVGGMEVDLRTWQEALYEKFK